MKNEKKGNKVTKEIKETLGEIFTKEYVKQMIITASVVIAVIVFCYFFYNTIVTFISGFLVVTAIIIYFAVKHYLKTKENTNINTCSSCGACWRKSEYITRIVYESLLSVRKILDIDVPGSPQRICAVETASPRFTSRFGFPANVPRLWYEVAWNRIRNPDLMDVMETEEISEILRKKIKEKFNMNYMWFGDSSIRGLWVDIIETDTYALKLMVVPFCNGVTDQYINARYIEDMQKRDIENIREEIVYDDEL